MFVAIGSAAFATEPKRVALVIGNGAYRHAPVLENPVNDAGEVAAALKKLGFEVVEGLDLDEVGIRRTIKLFAERLSGATVGLFFYAGHGLQVNGQNYLVPVDARLERPAGLDFELIRLDVVHRAMEAETSTNVIFLDACRDNPLSRNLARAMGTRSSQIGKGLAAVESGVGTLISFSTQPGNVALDGEGRNSPYAAALVKHISDPKEDLSTLLIQVRNDVMAATKDTQIPWEHSALRSKFYFAGIPPPPSAAPAGPTPEQQLELAFWASVKDSTNPAEIATYLDRYPGGTFAALARTRVEHHKQRLKAEEAAQEEARKRGEEARAAAEVKRLEQERAAREAALAQERKKALAAQNAAEAKRLEEQLRAEKQARDAELRKVQEDARLAREAAKAAEEKRLAAVKAAEEAAEEARKASQCSANETYVKGKCVVVPKREPATRKAAAPAPEKSSGGEKCRNSAGWVLPCNNPYWVNDASKVRQ